MNKNKASLLISFILVLITSFSIERLVSNYKYSLNDIDIFQSMKIENQFVYLMGSTEFMEKGNTLNKNRLNLNMWNKNQFLKFKKRPDSLSFTVNISDKANFFIILEGPDNLDLVVKFNKDEVTTLDWDRFDEPVPNKKIHGNAKYPARIEMKDGNLSINGKKLLTEKNYKSLSIKGNLEGDIWIDDLELNKEEISFTAPIDTNRLIGTVVIVSALVLLIPFAFLRTNVAIFLTILSIGVFFYDELYAQSHYVIDFLVYDEEEEDTELIRTELKRVKEELSQKKGNALFIGSSQTFGEGASNKEKRWTSLLCVDKELRCHNIAIRSGITKTFNRITTEIVNSNPSEVFYILGHNDDDVEDHYKNVDYFIKVMKKNNIKITLVIEPNIHNLNNDDPLVMNIMNLSKRQKVKLVDPRKYLKKNSWYWWDTVHMTDLGHFQFSKAF